MGQIKISVITPQKQTKKRPKYVKSAELTDQSNINYNDEILSHHVYIVYWWKCKLEQSVYETVEMPKMN